jgi:hypothetical protein
MIRTEPPDSKQAPAGDLRAAIEKHRPQFLIVTLPDPTFLPAQFDAHLESIQRALEKDGFLLDRFWLPYVEPGEGSKQGGGNNPQAAIRKERYERSEPGVMAFRGGECGWEMLIVFLVGETPKTGLQKLAFARAVDYVEQLSNGSPTLVHQKIRILGPTYICPDGSQSHVEFDRQHEARKNQR